MLSHFLTFTGSSSADNDIAVGNSLHTASQLLLMLFRNVGRLLVRWAKTHETAKVRVGSFEALVDWLSTARKAVLRKILVRNEDVLSAVVEGASRLVLETVEHGDSMFSSKVRH